MSFFFFFLAKDLRKDGFKKWSVISWSFSSVKSSRLFPSLGALQQEMEWVFFDISLSFLLKSDLYVWSPVFSLYAVNASRVSAYVKQVSTGHALTWFNNWKHTGGNVPALLCRYMFMFMSVVSSVTVFVPLLGVRGSLRVN